MHAVTIFSVIGLVLGIFIFYFSVYQDNIKQYQNSLSLHSFAFASKHDDLRVANSIGDAIGLISNDPSLYVQAIDEFYKMQAKPLSQKELNSLYQHENIRGYYEAEITDGDKFSNGWETNAFLVGALFQEKERFDKFIFFLFTLLTISQILAVLFGWRLYYLTQNYQKMCGGAKEFVR